MVLLEKDADLQAKEISGYTPLIFACQVDVLAASRSQSECIRLIDSIE